jgi:hypothetical protein
MTLRRWFVVMCGAVAIPAMARAQDSQFSLRGPGTPSRFESARARATGGAFAAFDGLSWMTDAALADLQRLTAAASGMASFREVVLDTITADLHSTRFPGFQVSAPLARVNAPVIAVGFGGYLDRSYRTIVRDSVQIGGEMEAYTDAIASDGGVSDLRLAGAFRLTRRLTLGAGFHLLSGRTRSSATRRYDDSSFYRATAEVTDVQHTGAGVSGGAIFNFRRLRLAAWARTDTELKVSVEDQVRARYDLPTSYGGALQWSPSPLLSLAGYVTSHSWSDAGGHDTIEWAVGAEGGGARMPLRLGVRGATLPFAPASVEPEEFVLAGGFARTFSQGRARVDVAVEYATRKGGDLQENVWSVLLGFSISP